jgi:stearoyl-CoA desaturase (delta-9 desaturase)
MISPVNETAGPKRLNLGKVAFLLLAPPATGVSLFFYISHSGLAVVDVALFLGLYIFTGIGITAGYHRYYSHRSYESHRFFEYLLVFFGTAALQTPVLNWASDHRYHHRHVDRDGDPYSINRGFFFAHMGWIFYDDVVEGDGERPFDNVADLKKDPLLRFQQKYYWRLAIPICFGLPTLIGAYFGRPFGGLLWGGMLRVLVTHHCIYLINSAAHTFGKRTYSSTHSARDSAWLAFFSFGEGFHNFHHTFASDYRNGIAWYHWDPTKWLIKGAEYLGLTSKTRVTSPAKIAQFRAGEGDFSEG